MEGKNHDSYSSPLLLQLKMKSLQQYLLYTDQSDTQVFTHQVPWDTTWGKSISKIPGVSFCKDTLQSVFQRRMQESRRSKHTEVTRALPLALNKNTVLIWADIILTRVVREDHSAVFSGFEMCLTPAEAESF